MPKTLKGMPRPEGAGRKKGSLNKKTLQVAEILANNGINLIDYIAERLPDLEKQEQVRTVVNLLPYVYPKLTSTEVKGDMNAVIEVIVRDYKSNK